MEKIGKNNEKLSINYYHEVSKLQHQNNEMVKWALKSFRTPDTYMSSGAVSTTNCVSHFSLSRH